VLVYASERELLDFASWIRDFPDHPDLVCRTLTRDIAFFAYDKL